VEELTVIMKKATAAIEPGYFQLSIHGGTPVYRERVYCYELYHQMRLLWPHDCTFYLNGEVDKAAHPILMQLNADGYKPDFLVHQPGNMAGNHAVMEVKSARSAPGGFVKDLKTLALFRSAVDYQRAIYLIYGNEIDDRLVDRIACGAAAMGLAVPIELWLHVNAGESAFCVTELEPAS
jgi:hypothetical protein